MAVDPGLVLRYSGIDSWEIGLSAAIPEAHDSGLDPDRAVFTHHRASRVALAGVLSSLSQTSTDHVVCDGGDTLVGLTAVTVGHDGNAHLLQTLGGWK